MTQGGRSFKKPARPEVGQSRGKVKPPKKLAAKQQHTLQKKLTGAIHKRIEKEAMARAGTSSLKILK
jgi:hypothetical protein